MLTLSLKSETRRSTGINCDYNGLSEDDKGINCDYIGTTDDGKGAHRLGFNFDENTVFK
jgi:hypothetical protein